MYEKDKTNRITLRLNDRQFNYVKANAEMLDVSPSDFLRIVINTTMVMYDHIDKIQEGIGRENDEANQHHIV